MAPMTHDSDRCNRCGVSRQQILQATEADRLRHVDMIRRASVFVNAVAVQATDKTLALAWLADAAALVDPHN